VKLGWRSAALLVALASCKPTPSPLTELVVPARSPSPRAPVLVLVHGYGANEKDLASLASRLDGRFEVHAVRAPIVLGPDSFSWFPIGASAEAEPSRKLLARYLEWLRSSPKVDASRVYLLGFSQGAMLGLSLAATDPELLAGVVAIGGRPLGLPGMAKRGAATRVLIVHGRQDSRVPFANAAESQRVLEALGRGVEVRAYDAGHEISPAMLADVDQWLTARLNETDAPPGG